MQDKTATKTVEEGRGGVGGVVRGWFKKGLGREVVYPFISTPTPTPAPSPTMC